MATWSATLWLDDISLEDHEALGLARMLWQYRGTQPRIQGWMSAFLEQTQSCEDLAFDVLTGVWPLTAIGVQLDNIGRIIGQDRYTLGDDAYRVMILGRIYVNRGDGQWQQFFELLEIIQCDELMVGYEFWPAAFEIACSIVTYSQPTGELVFDLKPGGVKLHFLYSDYEDTDLFKTASTLAADQSDADEGTENLAGTTGGRLMHMRYE